MKIYDLMKSLYYRIEVYKRSRYLSRLINRGLTLGKNVEIIDTFFFDPSHCFLISIGDNCTICPNVRLIAHDASTKKHLGYTKIGRIEIGERCFLGDSVIVLPSVRIGSHSIIGAGSVVTHDVPTRSVVAGNPARVIMTTDKYLEKISSISNGKRVFTPDYFIDRLDERKRNEIIESIGESIGFID
jgi:maltose O-acetyltransferase